jgi:hypothetical protein
VVVYLFFFHFGRLPANGRYTFRYEHPWEIDCVGGDHIAALADTDTAMVEPLGHMDQQADRLVFWLVKIREEDEDA